METEIQELNRDLERRVEQRTHQMEAANQELEAFAYSVSHDLRAPIRTITGFSEALGRDAGSCLSSAGRDHLQRIQGGAARMGQLIEDLLKLSRIGRDDYTVIPLDLGAMADHILAGFRAEDPGRKVICHVERPLRVLGDPRLLRLLLENLLGNAWKFTARLEEARIELTSQPVGQTIVAISVRDNGAGFPSAQANKLFTPFHRLHKQDEFPGTGIGLAIAKRIVSRHGGMIHAEGETGQGAVIRFTLPVATEDRP
jgi:signal transduction histidine kinase